MRLRYLKNSSGEEDGAWTLAFFTWLVIIAKFAVAGLVVGKLNLGAAPDSGLVTALLGTTMATYWARRHTDANAPK